jgi:hypothetical protein
MNAPSPATTFLTPQRLDDTRELASWHEDQGRSGTAVTIRTLVAEIELLREAVKGSLVIVNQAQADKNLAQLRASSLLIVADKITPVLDRYLDEVKRAGNIEWGWLQVLSDELEATLKVVRS